jgi:hypothetical protein
MSNKYISKALVFTAFAIAATAFQFAGFGTARAQAATGNCVENASLTAPQVIPASVAPGAQVPFKILIYNSGETWFHHGSYFQLVQKTGFNVSPPYGHLTPSMHPRDDQMEDFVLTAPTAPGTYTITYQMLHKAGAGYLRSDASECAPIATSDTYFGNSISMTFTVAAPNENCADASKYLEGVLINEGASGLSTGRVTNKSRTCTYPIGIASYKMYFVEDPNGSDSRWLTTQTLFDSKTFTIRPGQTINTDQIFVSTPDCRFQVDLFEGEVMTPPWYGFTQGHYLMDFAWSTKPVCAGNPTPPTPTPVPPTPNPVPPTPTPTPPQLEYGTIMVTANISTTWIVTGPQNFSGSGVYASYTAIPGTYTVANVPQTLNIGGTRYELDSINPPSQYLNADGTGVFRITYDEVISVRQPSINAASNETCSQIKLSWSDNSNNENGFRIYRSEQEHNGDLSQYEQIATLGANATQYVDHPSINRSYFYVVVAYMNSPARTAASEPFHSSLNVACAANVDGSISIVAINGQPVSDLNTLNDNDTVTIQLLVDNLGPASGYVTKITDTLSSTLVNPRNLQASGPNIVVGNPRISGSHPDVTFNVSGRKDVGGQKWIVKFDATLDVPDNSTMQQFSSCATIFYFDEGGNKSDRFCLSQMLAKGLGSGAGINFREVAP